MSSKHDVVQWFEKEFSINFTHVTKDEYAGTNGCPWCGSNGKGISDRFHVWTEKQNYWCRVCGKAGFLDELTGEKDTYTKLTDHEKRIIALERQAAEQERRQADIQKQVDALSVMMRSKDHLQYHQNLDAEDYEYWRMQGISRDSVDFYNLGLCFSCPMAPSHPSWTIPVYDSQWTSLLNIRHRLVDVDDGDRYRPHMAGLKAQLFNSRFVLSEKELLLVEGEKKSIVTSDKAYPAIATLGTSFNLEWLKHFDGVQKLYIAFDPDAIDKAWKLGADIRKRVKHIDVKVCTLPAKPDDMLTYLGGDRDDLLYYMNLARSA